MQDFLRRNFWAVHLSVIAVGCYLTAGVTTEVAAMLLLKPAPRAAGQAAAPAAVPKSVKPDSKVSLAGTLGGHNVFDAEPEIVIAEEGEGAAEPEPKSIDIDLDLLGTLVSPNPEWSLATIRLQGQSKLVRIGVVLNDTVTVAEIASRYLILQQGALTKVVRLWEEKGSGARPGLASAGPKPPPAIGGPAPGASDFSKGVKKLGAYDFQIDRGMLEENLQDLTKLGMQARIVPNYEDGKYHGFRLVGIRPDSLYRAIGLESGDLVKRVNGRDIDTPNKAIELFESLRSSPTISLDVERRGQKATMSYSIK